MIKDRQNLIKILRIDNQLQDSEIELLAKRVRSNLVHVIDIASEQLTKDVAQKKIDLIDSCYEESRVEQEQELIDERYSLSEETVCRLTREKLFGINYIHLVDVNKMLDILKAYDSSEANYLKGLLELKKTKGRESDFDSAVSFLKKASEQDPNNQNYKMVFEMVLNMQENFLKAEEMRARKERERMETERKRYESELAERERAERQNKAIDTASIVPMLVGGLLVCGFCMCCISLCKEAGREVDKFCF